MFFQILSYIKFLWRSTNQHGIHSPFVFDLVTQCFYDKKKYPGYSALKIYRKSLLQNNNFINVTDFGAGSKVFKSNKRQVSKIAQTAGITAKNAELLYRVVRYFKPDAVLEIGTSLGLATSALSLGNPNSKIVTLEGCPETSRTAQSQFQKFDLKNIVSTVAEFEAGLSDFSSAQFGCASGRSSTFDLIYFDGNHQKDATLHYFDLLLPTVNNGSVWIFDDIHWSAQMEEAWEIIKKNPRVTVTVDTFQWGFVFFRKEQNKQDFVIRA